MAISNKTAVVWSFISGVVTALIITAAAFVLISGAPIPFVNKVQQVSATVDPALLDGKSIDPNAPLYGDAAGADRGGSDVASVSTAEAGATDADVQRFWVQAGTFSDAQEAESMRARIAFIGLDAQITNRTENGQRVFRVRIGPFDTPEQAEEIRQSLSDNGIQSSVLQQNR